MGHLCVIKIGSVCHGCEALSLFLGGQTASSFRPPDCSDLKINTSKDLLRATYLDRHQNVCTYVIISLWTPNALSYVGSWSAAWRPTSQILHKAIRISVRCSQNQLLNSKTNIVKFVCDDILSLQDRKNWVQNYLLARKEVLHSGKVHPQSFLEPEKNFKNHWF